MDLLIPKKEEEKVPFLRHICLSSEIRDLKTPHEKAVFLKRVTGYSDEMIGSVVGLHRRAVLRARKSAEKGIELGKNGRPFLINKKQEGELIECINLADKYKNSLSRSQVRDEVQMEDVIVVIQLI